MEGLITLIILIISAIGWVMNAAQEQKNKQQQRQQRPDQPGRPPGQQPKRSLQSEIEQFLKDVQEQQAQARQGEKAEAPAKKFQREQRPHDPFTDPVRKVPEQRPAPVKQSHSQKRKARQTTSQKKKSAPAAAAADFQQSLTTTYESTPQTVAMLQTQLNSPLASAFSQELAHKFTPEQIAQLTQLARKHPQPAAGSSPKGATIREMLSSKDQIQNSFVINEILQPPLALRAGRKS